MLRTLLVTVGIAICVAVAISSTSLVRENATLRHDLSDARARLRQTEIGLLSGNTPLELDEGRFSVIAIAASQASANKVRLELASRPTAACGKCTAETPHSPESPAGQPLDGTAVLPDFTSIRRGGSPLLRLEQRYLGGQEERPYTLFVFLSPTDCPVCLQEAAVWEELNQAGRALNLTVVGVMDHASNDEATQFLKGAGLTFPVILDESGQLVRGLRIERTPYKVLINKAAEVLLTDTPNQGSERQHAFGDAIKRAVLQSR